MLNLRCMWIPGTLLIGMMGCTTSGSVLEPFDGGQQGRAALLLDAVTPALGPTAGGITLQLEGSGFAPGATVNVAGTIATDVTVFSTNRLTATLPAKLGAFGRVPVVVTNPDSSKVTRGDLFSYYASYPDFAGRLFDTDAAPLSAATGDFDGDGKLDLVTANILGNSVSVLLNRGISGFGPPANYPVAAGPNSVAVGDLDGDGKPDLAVAAGDNVVNVLLNEGKGIFGPATIFTVDSRPTAVAVSDLDGDGKLDLAVATWNGVSVLLNDGKGGFSSITSFQGGPESSWVAAGDLNGDGNIDLAVTNSAGVSVFLNDGKGGFGSATKYSANQGPSSVAIVDFNHDGMFDLAVTNYDSNDLTLLLNKGNGIFENYGDPIAVGLNPSAVTVGDFNGDGQPDLAVTAVNNGNGNNWTGEVTLLLGERFLVTEKFPIGAVPSSVVVGDFNGDGKQDLAIPIRLSNGVNLLFNDGRANFGTSPDYFAVNGPPKAIAIGDLDGDGNLDIAVVAYGDTIGVLLNDGKGGFSPVANHSVCQYPFSVAVADFNGDNKPDLIVTTDANMNSSICVLLNDGTGHFGPPISFPSGASRPTLGPMKDFNGDGKADLTVTGPDGYVRVYLNLASGNGPDFSRWIDDAPGPVAVGDLNGDGKLDLVVPAPAYSNVSVLLGDGKGGFGVPLKVNAGTNPASVVIGDFNGDGKLDLATTNPNSNTVSLLLNDGKGGFGVPTSFNVGNTPESLASGDFNGDGKLDLAVSNTRGDSISVLLNDGKGGFDPVTLAISPDLMVVGDFNGDGKPDLASATSAFYVSVSLNQSK